MSLERAFRGNYLCKIFRGVRVVMTIDMTLAYLPLPKESVNHKMPWDQAIFRIFRQIRRRLSSP